MKRMSKGIHLILGLILAMWCCLPGQAVFATEGEASRLEFKIVKGSVSDSGLQPGDSFSLYLTVRVTDGSEGAGYTSPYFSKAYVSGCTSEKSEPSISCDSDITGSGDYQVTVSNLYYDGSSNSVSVSVEAESHNTSTGDVVTFSTGSYNVKVSGYTSGELGDMVEMDKQENILVKTGSTQNIQVPVTNKGSITIRQAEAQLSLGSKVEGLKIKQDTSKVSNLKSKETKKATFTVEVDKDTKAGVYPATVTVLGESFPVKIQVDSSVVPSALEVSMKNDGIFTPGVAKEASIQISNVGERDAKNIRVEVVNTENVAIMENSNVKRLNIVKAKNVQNLQFKVKITSSFKGESVALPIKISYLSSNGEQAEEQQYIYLPTNNTSAASEVLISNVISPTGVFEVDQNFNVKFNISSKKAASNIQISVEGDEGIVPKSQNLFFLNKLNAGETKQYMVSLAATREAVTSSHPIKIAVTYGQGDNATTINQYCSVNIVNSKKDKEDSKDDEKQKGKPKVIIGQYAIEPQIVQAGQNFKLTLGFLNTSTKHTVHNLKANILPAEQASQDGKTTTDNVFTPVDGSNTIYISQLGYEEEYTTTLNMYTIPSASAKTYQITVNMAYEDEEGNEVEATETLGIPVEQVTKIEIGDIYVDMGEVGMPTPLSVTFYNRGRTNINNMMVYVKGEGFDIQDNRTFVGTFEMGESESYEPTLIPNQAGQLSGTLVVEYEDPSGNPQIIEQPFEFEAEEVMMEDMSMDEPEEDVEADKQGVSKKVILLGVGIAAVIIVIIVVIVLKKRKAKKEERLLDEED